MVESLSPIILEEKISQINEELNNRRINQARLDVEFIDGVYPDIIADARRLLDALNEGIPDYSVRRLQFENVFENLEHALFQQPQKQQNSSNSEFYKGLLDKYFYYPEGWAHEQRELQIRHGKLFDGVFNMVRDLKALS